MAFYYGRDYQRSKVYKAENRVLSGHPHEMDFGLEIAHGQRLVTAAVRSAWISKTYPGFKRATVQVRRQRTGGARAHVWEGYIQVSGTMNRNWVLMHELAHVITHAECRRLDVPLAAHGRDFARCYLGLVREWVSELAYKDLRASFTKAKVKARGTDQFHFARVERRKAAKLARDLGVG
jgi:hypothetical protein